MRPLIRTVVPLLVFLGLATPAAAQLRPQLPLQLELRVGAAFPVGAFADRDPGVGARVGPRLEAGGVVRLAPWLGVFGGVSRAEFGCGACGGVGLDDTVVERGGSAGLEFAPAFALVGLATWLRAGAVFQQLEFRGDSEDLDTSDAVGYMVGGGVVLPLRGPIRLRPGLHYRGYGAGLELGAFGDRTVDVGHLTLDLGISVHF
jgi:hypothetical protein